MYMQASVHTTYSCWMQMINICMHATHPTQAETWAAHEFITFITHSVTRTHARAHTRAYACVPDLDVAVWVSTVQEFNLNANYIKNSPKHHIFALASHFQSFKVVHTTSCKTWKWLCKGESPIYRQEQKIQTLFVTCPGSKGDELDVQIVKWSLFSAVSRTCHFAIGNRVKLANT